MIIFKYVQKHKVAQVLVNRLVILFWNTGCASAVTPDWAAFAKRQKIENDVFILNSCPVCPARGSMCLSPLSQIIHTSLSSSLKHKQANQSICQLWPRSDSYTAVLRWNSYNLRRICHFGSVGFELIMVKRRVWGTFKSAAHYSARFEGDLHSLPFQN